MNDKNILFCSVGRRVKLLMDFRESMQGCGKIVAADLSPVAPALFFADKMHTVPEITAPDYFERIKTICRQDDVKAITTLIDPEIALLASHRDELQEIGILPLCPADWTARLCFDKYEMFMHLRQKGVRTVLTYNTLAFFQEGLRAGEIAFPVFMKPVTGSGSVGVARCDTMQEVEKKWYDGKFTYIIQELMTGGDCDADVYVDCISHKPVAIFSKKKIESRIGGLPRQSPIKTPSSSRLSRRSVLCWN